MKEFLIIAFLLAAIGVIILVLLQQGKGAGMGASFGAGASATLFGSSGAGNFLTRATAILATLFFIICLALANLASRPQQGDDQEWMNLDVPATEMNTVNPASVAPSDVPVDASKANTESKEADKKDSVADIPL